MFCPHWTMLLMICFVTYLYRIFFFFSSVGTWYFSKNMGKCRIMPVTWKKHLVDLNMFKHLMNAIYSDAKRIQADPVLSRQIPNTSCRTVPSHNDLRTCDIFWISVTDPVTDPGPAGCHLGWQINLVFLVIFYKLSVGLLSSYLIESFRYELNQPT